MLDGFLAETLLTLSRESNNTLTKAVHALYGICRPDTVPTNTKVTTESILERLGLSEHMSFEEGSVLTHRNMECKTGPKASVSTGPELSTSGFGEVSDTANIGLAFAPESLSSATHSSPRSDQYQSSSAARSEPTSCGTEVSWESVATGPSPDKIQAAMPPLTCQQKSPLLSSYGFGDIDSVTHNDFDLYLGLMAEGVPAGQLPATEDKFGFDPLMWLPEPGRMDWAPSSSAFANIQSDIDNSQRLCTSPLPLTTTTESAKSVTYGGGSYSPIANPQDSEQLAQATAIPSTQKPPAAQRRPGLPHKTSPVLQDNSVSVAEQRRVSLEKNRLAANKCREKKKAEVDALKDASVVAKVENSLLKQQATKLREEILALREDLLTHVLHSECCAQEKMRPALGAIGSGVTSAT